MPRTEVYVSTDDVIIDVKVEYGEVHRIEKNIFKITFIKARGGETLLFGRRISDNRPELTNTVRLISKSGKIQTSFSEIILHDTVTINDTIVYQIQKK